MARLGGDEFAIVLSGVNGRAEVEAAAVRVLAAFDEPFEVGGRRIALGASWAAPSGRRTLPRSRR